MATPDIINQINIGTYKYVKDCKDIKTPRHVEMTRKYLKEKELLAVPFDKGNGFCVMKKRVYNDKLHQIIDGKQFSKVKSKR